MEIPVQITFRDIPHSPAMESRIHEYVNKLERYYPRIIRCRVVVEAPHRHQHKGNIYHCGIEISVPGSEIIVNRDPKDNHAHEDAYVAIRDAFQAASRQLEEFGRRQRGDVKVHEGPEEGTIERIFPEDGYGFISTLNGRQVYFHKNSVVDGDFATLEVGTKVGFVAAEGESPNGPQATTVHPLSRPA